MSDYFSFLICFHEAQINVFMSGLPIGVIRNGEFFLHQLKNGDGSSRPLHMHELGGGTCPFETIEELRQAVTDGISKLQVPAKPKADETPTPVG